MIFNYDSFKHKIYKMEQPKDNTIIEDEPDGQQLSPTKCGIYLIFNVFRYKVDPNS